MCVCVYLCVSEGTCICKFMYSDIVLIVIFDPQGNTEYFQTSGDKIRFFFEEGVFDDKGESHNNHHNSDNHCYISV